MIKKLFIFIILSAGGLFPLCAENPNVTGNQVNPTENNPTVPTNPNSEKGTKDASQTTVDPANVTTSSPGSNSAKQEEAKIEIKTSSPQNPTQSENELNNSQNAEVTVVDTTETEPVPNGESIEDPDPKDDKSSNKGSGWALFFSISSLALAGYLLWKSKKTEERRVQMAKNESKLIEMDIRNLQGQIMKLNKELDKLFSENSGLRDNLKSLELKINRISQQDSSSNYVDSNFRKNKSPEARSSEIVCFINELSIDDFGEPFIANWQLQNANKGIFRVVINLTTGEGTYELNPNSKDDEIKAQIETLNRFADGVNSNKQSGYQTSSKGMLEKTNGGFRVKKKLIIS